MNNKIILFLIAIFSYVGFFFYPSSKISSTGFYNLNDKLWAHRVLNLSEINKLSKEFPGFELDVLYNKKLSLRNRTWLFNRKKIIEEHNGQISVRNSFE